MFKSARLKLTLWYLVIIMLVSGAFSAMIYSVQVSELDRFVRLERFRMGRFVDPDLVGEAKQRLAIFLLLTDAGILVVAGGASYFLAGRTLRPIAQMVEEQNQFVGDASHELRTPLAALKSALEVNLRDKNMTIKEARALFSEAIGEVDKLQSLSEGLLQLAQHHESNGKTKKEEVAIGEAVQRAMKKLAGAAAKKKIVIADETGEQTVWGNNESMVDLLVILLDNAIKYSPEKSTVSIGSSKTNGDVRIYVSDFGIGIAKKDMPHVFDRFYRADMARAKSGAGGYGLGLAIAKKIAEENGGTIEVESEMGVGTTLQVVFRNGS